MRKLELLSVMNKQVSLPAFDSAYKAFVSIFSWAAKSDLLVEWYHPAGMEESSRERPESEKETFEMLCRLVQREEWENRGIKSSKDFLMGLGSGFYADGTYNGFYIQRYGLKEPLKSIDESSPRRNERAPYSEASLYESIPMPPHLDEGVEAILEQRNDYTALDVSGTYQQHIAEQLSSPNFASTSDLGQSQQSHNVDNLLWDDFLSLSDGHRGYLDLYNCLHI